MEILGESNQPDENTHRIPQVFHPENSRDFRGKERKKGIHNLATVHLTPVPQLREWRPSGEGSKGEVLSIHFRC